MNRRILAAMLTLTGLLLAGVVVPLGLAQAAHDRLVFTRRTLAAATAVATLAEERLVDHAGGVSRPGAIAAVTGGTLPAPGSTVSVYDAAGRPVGNGGLVALGSAAQVRQALAGHDVAAAPADDRLLVVVPVRSASRVVGATALVRTTGQLDREVAALWAGLGAAGALALAVACALSVALARWVGRPLRRLDVAAGQLGGGELTVRAQITSGPPEVRELASSFNTMAARLQNLVEAHQVFLADVSHQLRTPLAALRLRLELLAQDLVGEQVGELDGALAELGRLSRLVDGVLAVSRAEHTQARPGPVDATAVCRDRVTAWTPVADERGVNLRLSAPPAPVTAAMTSGHLEQVLDNLLDNALEATPEHGEVEVRVDRDASGARVEVLDTGPGMTPARRQVAFTRFWTGRGGSGLGLAIVHRLITGDGGQISLGQAPSGGLAVRLVLPVPAAGLPTALDPAP